MVNYNPHNTNNSLLIDYLKKYLQISYFQNERIHERWIDPIDERYNIHNNYRFEINPDNDVYFFHFFHTTFQPL
jgi:hypothetical protein